MLKKTDSLATTRTLKLFNQSDLHIEISSKCTLKCPRCPRTELPYGDLNQEFSLLEFQTAFPLHYIKEITNILFCGDIGDPIYATEFVDIVEYIKSNSLCNLLIITNGSYRKQDWWTRLGNALNENDTVQFSIDGWDQDSNAKYRVNSDFESILTGINTLKDVSKCRIKISSIYFNFNESEMTRILDLAKSLGVDEWQSVCSTKFNGRYLVNGVDPLIPSDHTKISEDSLYKMNSIVLNRARPVRINYQRNAHKWARCLNWKKEMFISASGLVFPCPWFNSGYNNNDFVQKYKDQINVKRRSLESILGDPLWEEFIARLETMPLDICKIKCRGCE